MKAVQTARTYTKVFLFGFGTGWEVRKGSTDNSTDNSIDNSIDNSTKIFNMNYNNYHDTEITEQHSEVMGGNNEQTTHYGGE